MNGGRAPSSCTSATSALRRGRHVLPARRVPARRFSASTNSRRKDAADAAVAAAARAFACPSDPVADALASLGARGVHVAWAGAEDEREAAAVALCGESIARPLKKMGHRQKIGGAAEAPPGGASPATTRPG